MNIVNHFCVSSFISKKIERMRGARLLIVRRESLVRSKKYGGGALSWVLCFV